MNFSKIIFSSNQGFKELTLQEIGKVYKNSVFVKWLDEERGVIKIDDERNI